MSFQSVDQIIKHYTKELDKPMREVDYDLIADERAERYNRALQRRLASCGDREYPPVYARQDIIEAEQERLRLMGIVDISEVEEAE